MTDTKQGNTEWLDSELYTPFHHEQALLYEHADSVAARAFLKFVNLPFTLEQRPNAEFMSPNGSVPFLRIQNILVAGFLEIVDFVAQKGIKLTNTLSEAETADMAALIALIHENLVNSEKFFCWKDSVNYMNVTKSRYGIVYPQPLKLILPFLKRREILSELNNNSFGESVSDAVASADACFNALSVKLGNNSFLMGSEPTELDALAFGHIFTILTTELPTNHLVNSLRKYSNLVKYCCDIDENYFKM